MKLFIKDVKDELGISTRELSKKSCVARTYLQKMENGEAKPSICTLCKLAKAMNVEVGELFSCDEYP